MHVAVVMGSDSDLPVMKKAFAVLDDFGVSYDAALASAHRTPEKLSRFVADEEKKGASVFIAGAGMAAALPGVVASLTTKPVVGIPLSGAKLDGMDALLSIVQMPSGMPVATVAIDGAKNAALLAIQMGALSDEGLAAKYRTYREDMARAIYEKDEKLQKELGR
ncbi:MAG: 5-(carboxyamino)imidazole ribonucleotide mutase [Allisonella histaminiformans]|uniref:N5-carboxyaminoimidazole ribonucleotide mutase n=1 Tax=Allisonella histaminiformans TaxID=209880 RepID=A0A1G5VVW1_9FIRM|nr:5-(carboxyamino)imidazole ribonucleotide mutase [Allisonella histaminiformans]MCI6003046.1 5-(carboxyamino)imidazole ribonucleotide mutase [Allisonella histaminiformans]MDD6870120.1 5-(carboxyamino)imidazole ribonucleotide mutase [Allisonella histaminiformans]MDY3956951.1 5-(carboxyamino)imidazole ribonucleotide mutase [Allisonella histaminiformans]MDY4540489.1 5-(carboxyamino)imidazole ribonucleotide mutase [Allisonella histaminiformans]SDA49844.1 5-(carboxyamino)imidazole ribonucleotide m